MPAFCRTPPTAGRVALMSQSGAVGAALLERLEVSSFVSVGNKADVSGNDLLAMLARSDEQLRQDVLARTGARHRPGQTLEVIAIRTTVADVMPEDPRVDIAGQITRPRRCPPPIPVGGEHLRGRSHLMRGPRAEAGRR
ncbi:hypothetical protein AB0H88_51900 [Nonomuraea sp. NPDC050680]|uniref:hypothetical protein n=1 Tax=Nonomuraea sp. NPDC050680 TaxID=3154630 RepID=UPI003410E49B